MLLLLIPTLLLLIPTLLLPNSLLDQLIHIVQQHGNSHQRRRKIDDQLRGPGHNPSECGPAEPNDDEFNPGHKNSGGQQW